MTTTTPETTINSTPPRMQAIIFPTYGSPDVLQLTEIEKPVPSGKQVLIKVHAASGNPLDWHRMRGAPFLVRLEEGMRRPKNPRLGADVAGVVEAVGPEVTRFKPGDAVFGCVVGSLAQYVLAGESILAAKPDKLSFEEAAAMPVVALTALQGLRDTGKIKAGQQVLINGASGGVGSAAVQIAKAYGAEVTGVCSTRNLELVRSIGADHVVDYTQEDFTRQGKQYDLIYCAVGNRSAAAYRRALKPGGVCSIAGFTTLPHLLVQTFLLGAFVTRTSDKTITSMGTAQANEQDMRKIAEMLASGQLKAVIDRTYPLRETADAIRYLETMRARGKVIITVPHNGQT
jgi:NADPH:quinone reductase-like Zn-dependent oxidoreductase